MVLDVVVSPSREEFGDLSPLVAEVLMSFDNRLVFLFRPLASLDIWVQVVVPSLSALLPNAAREER